MELISNSTGNWEIYRIIDKGTSEAYIVRFPIMNFGINSYLNNYRTVKNTGLPTLNLVEKFQFGRKIGIRTEDLNYMQDKIYVTHNSLYSDSRKIVAMLSQHIIKIDLNKKSPEYEEFRYRNKLAVITNFEEFVFKTKKDLMHASQQDVLIEFDSYFFGTQKLSEISSIDYKIVDLDNIYTATGKKSNELYDENVLEFERAICGFIRYFVNEEDQPTYLKYFES